MSKAARLVGHTLETHMDGAGCCWPAVPTIAREGALSARTVGFALKELEQRGFLYVDWSKGGNGGTHRFQATLPPTANPLRSSEWNKATSTAKPLRSTKKLNPEDTALNPEKTAPNPEATSDEAVKTAKHADAHAASQRTAPQPCNTCGGNLIDADGFCLALECNGRAVEVAA